MAKKTAKNIDFAEQLKEVKKQNARRLQRAQLAYYKNGYKTYKNGFKELSDKLNMLGNFWNKDFAKMNLNEFQKYVNAFGSYIDKANKYDEITRQKR